MSDEDYMRLALRLARRASGFTSPNPAVGAVLVKEATVLGAGYHHRAGAPHAEIEALRDALRKGHRPIGSTLYVTLEPCSTWGRTPPCTRAILEAGIHRVVVGATDPNPAHSGRAFSLLRRAGIQVHTGVLAAECTALNAAFNHWIVHHRPYVTVKAAMTLDGKIATATGESKWITTAETRKFAMRLRHAADAILVGVNTVIADDPSLTWRGSAHAPGKVLKRVILDSLARMPADSKVVTDEFASATTIFASHRAPLARIKKLSRHGARVILAPEAAPKRGGAGKSPMLQLPWILRKLGAEGLTHLLIEGGSEVNASFLGQHLAQSIVFFYAPKIVRGRTAPRAVGGLGAREMSEAISLHGVRWRRIGPDLMLEASCLQ